MRRHEGTEARRHEGKSESSPPFVPSCLCAFVPFLLALVGCVKQQGVIFPPRKPPLVFPAPPEQPRIRYVGQLATSADLKPAVPVTQAFGEALFGKAETASMLTPYAVCTDGRDRVFVADSNAQVVHVFDLKNRKYARWHPDNKESRFAQPVGIAFDGQTRRLYVADSAAGHVQMFDPYGNDLGELGPNVLNRPVGLAFEVRTGRLFVADAGQHQVLVFGRDRALLARIGTRGTELGQFNYPTNVAVDSQGRLYVSDSLNFRVQQFAPDLKPIRQIGRKGDMPGYFAQPKGIAVDSEDHLYVVDANFESIQIFDASGALLMDFGAEGNGDAEFWLPAGIFIDRRNRIWIADSYNRRVQVLDYLPEVKR